MKTFAPTQKNFFRFYGGMVLSAMGLLLFEGCSPTLSNLTPETTPKNPSNTYRLTLHSKLKPNDVLQDSFKASVVIDGEKHLMENGPWGPNFFVYDYYMPGQRAEAAYYFSLNYDKNIHGRKQSKEIKTPLYRLKISERRVFSLECERAPVGTKVPVLGRGLKPEDKIIIGDFAANTEYVSGNVLLFTVPTLLPEKSYNVFLLSVEDKQFVGSLLVDKAKLHADLESIELRKGEKVSLTLSTDNSVSESGLALDVTTDVPDSVIMPEVLIPAKSNSVTVTIEGGEAGEGQLFVAAPGYEEMRIPIKVVGESGQNVSAKSDGVDANSTMNDLSLED